MHLSLDFLISMDGIHPLTIAIFVLRMQPLDQNAIRP
jgi:hypothetical protein